ncbi:GCN5-related N-acetyltransferase [Catenulispora acidiphila DSM 44928]|uniref:GCN5-related N-acetyltransferase n=1 Tax=Catenulispora acidiphila (strain DSM 44928 / JCM 14897 / NBRC 102108 / NRRL B-24433 / ID139908) TaxID=479433 RepID=C7QII0_CATAD|nr:GNAT family N-acetyltransferase [Catenulispora acidiphila]ACU75057.1 GCN5-related N-acetyltransferase [Catenulispora acidiphila DSM 44928]
MTDRQQTMQITRASLADWPLIQGWCADEGWNPGDHDGPCFLAQDPEGFFVGRVDGEPVSAVSVVHYGDAFAFLGLHLVRPEFRGRGHGLATWKAALPRAGARTVGLDSTAAQQDIYRKSGFDDAYRTVRYVGDLASDGSGPAAAVPLARAGFAEIADYDALCFPAPRPVFLREWFAAPGHVGRALIVDGRLVGYGVLRPAHDGYRVGPLFADSRVYAEVILDALVAGAVGDGGEGGRRIVIDVPDTNPEALAMVGALGLEPSFEMARMYTGPVRDVDHSKVFGTTTLELG